MARIRSLLVPVAATVATLSAAGISATPTSAGEIHGRVILAPGTATPPMQQASLNPYPGMGAAIDAPAHSQHESAGASPADAVVIVEGQFAGMEPATHQTPALTQQGLMFSPRVIAIPVGGTVTFPNEDMVFHNVFSYSKPKKFDLGYYGKGKSKTVTFDTPGLVKVFCDIHSHMSAFIYVSDSPFVTTPDSNGNFSITGIPDGDYKVRVWHPESGERTFSAHVTASSDALELRL